MLAMAQDGRVLGLAVQAAAVVQQVGGALVDVVLHEHAEPNLELMAQASEQLDLLLSDPQRSHIRLLVRLASRAEIELLAPQVPSGGLRTLWLRRAASDPPAASCDFSPRIANDSLEVEAAPDGTLRLTDRRTGRSYAGLLRFSDVAECGDSYTHSSLAGEAAMEALPGSVRIERRCDALGETLELTLAYSVPGGLTPDRSRRKPDTVQLPVRVTAHLAPGIPRLDLAIEVENAADDHRLQVLFPTGAPLSEAWYGGSYEIVRRPTALAAGGADWAEQPAHEVPLRGFLADRPSDGLLIAARGLREASASPDGVLAVTLLRCFGWLSRDDLATRKGAAGPLIETPGGQEHGVHRFELSLIPFSGDLLSALPLAETFDAGLRASMTPLHAGRVPAEASFISLQPRELQVTAVKAAEDGLGIVVRLLNPSPVDVQALLTSFLPLQWAQRARLDETALGRCPSSTAGACSCRSGRIRQRPCAWGSWSCDTPTSRGRDTWRCVAAPRVTSWVAPLVDACCQRQQAGQHAQSGGRQEDGIEAEAVRLHAAHQRTERTGSEGEAEDQSRRSAGSSRQQALPVDDQDAVAGPRQAARNEGQRVAPGRRSQGWIQGQRDRGCQQGQAHDHFA